MLYPNPNMLVYIAKADAYLLAGEFVPWSQYKPIREALLEFRMYLSHPEMEHERGRYSDDGEMSAANSRVLANFDPPFKPIMFADSWIHEFLIGNMRIGYAREFHKFLCGCSGGQDFLDRIGGDSDKNGGMMRSMPIGVLPTVEQVLEVTTMQAAITHNTQDGLFGARAVALMSHLALHTDIPLAEIPREAYKLLPDEDQQNYRFIMTGIWTRNVPIDKSSSVSLAVNTLRAVCDLLTYEDSLMAMMRRIIGCGGDTDTVGAIAWGIASARFQDEVLPEFMQTDLEGGSAMTGIMYLEKLGRQLMSKYDV